MSEACKVFFSGATLDEWRTGYQNGEIIPDGLLEMVKEGEAGTAWITPPHTEGLRRQIGELAAALWRAGGDLSRFPLYGIPFAVKDNIDVGGWPTTASCPAFAYVAREDATVVRRLRKAGAIVVGKTNLDQFATGLVGTRSPYGIVRNAFRDDYISGGSSSGSASVVARGLVPFALGTDTAGSGRVPAGFNNIVGLKPTRGWLSTSGVVPACRTLDCVSVLALTVADAQLVASIAGGADETDAYSRRMPDTVPTDVPAECRLAIPAELEFFGDKTAGAAFSEALDTSKALGARIVPVTFAPFQELAELLYNGPWIAERLAATGELWKREPEAIHPTVREIIGKGQSYSAVEFFEAEYRRAALVRRIAAVMESVDAMLVPTTPSIYKISEVMQEPITLNARLGTYTNFANLADLSALALPAGFRSDGLPAGVTLLAPAWHDRALSGFGRRWERHYAAQGSTRGATGRPLLPQPSGIRPANGGRL